MKKIILKNVNTKKFTNLMKRSASLDNLIFITVKGSEFESASYNKNKSALKNVTADLEKLCDNFQNDFEDESVKIQFGNANKFIQVLSLVGTDDVNIEFYVEDNGYAKKVLVKNTEIELSVPCADREAVDFLEIPEQHRYSIFEDNSKLHFAIDITENEFKYINQVFGLTKESVRVFFNLVGNDVFVSEIESTDENVRKTVNDIITNGDVQAFNAYEKIYSKKLNIDNFQNNSGTDEYLACFNKQYFALIDPDHLYTVEFHSNKVRFISYDEESSVKTYVVLTPVRFA